MEQDVEIQRGGERLEELVLCSLLSTWILPLKGQAVSFGLVVAGSVACRCLRTEHYVVGKIEKRLYQTHLFPNTTDRYPSCHVKKLPPARHLQLPIDPILSHAE
jgi:hypothetical protein